MKIIVRKFGCFKNFLLYLETLLHITRPVFVIRKKLMSESSQNSTQILLDGQNGSPNSKQHPFPSTTILLYIQGVIDGIDGHDTMFATFYSNVQVFIC